MKPKQWLFENGHIKTMGRGRVSAAHQELLKKAVSEGVEIEGYSTPKKATAPKRASVPKPDADSTGVVSVREVVRSDREWSAHIGADAKTIGMRTVCDTCKSSFTYCACPNPCVILDDFTLARVTFKRLTKPIEGRLW